VERNSPQKGLRFVLLVTDFFVGFDTLDGSALTGLFSASLIFTVQSPVTVRGAGSMMTPLSARTSMMHR
jgi:hypothetical protein